MALQTKTGWTYHIVNLNPSPPLVTGCTFSKTISIGAKFKLTAVTLGQLGSIRDSSGELFTTDSIIEVFEYNTDYYFELTYKMTMPTFGNMLIAFKCELGKTCGAYIDFALVHPNGVIWLDKEEVKDECTCPNFDLANFGCKCGYLKKRREAGLE